MRVHPSFMRCESQRQCDTARRPRLLPVAGDVDDPVLPGRLLLVVPLVLAGGIGVIDHRSANTAIIDIVIAPRPCSSLAVKRSDFGSTMVDPVAFMAHVHHVRDPDLAVVDLPVALLGDPLLLGLGGGRTGRGGRGSAEASEMALDPNRPRADEVKFREMSREIFERAYLPDEWKPAYNAARRTRSQLHRMTSESIRGHSMNWGAC